MPLQGEYEPSTQDWVREQVELYEGSGGTEGTTRRGLPVVIVTNLGARSGKIRKTPLMRVEHDGAYAAVASQGGAPEHPVWYHNLVAHPLVEVQDGPVKQDMTARLTSGAEKALWWERAVAAYPPYADYQRSTEREIPLFVLEPVGHAHGEAGHVHDVACAIAHGDVPPPVEDRRLVAVFDSPVARELAHFAAHVGFDVVVLDPAGAAAGGPFPVVTSASAAALDGRTDVVVTDHDRPELGDVLAEVLRESPRWIGVMGSPRHTAPHIALLQDRGFDEAAIARVHRPIGLNIGSHSPAEIAISTVAGLLADRNGRPGGTYS